MSTPVCPGKLSWPELIGTKGKAAAKKIEKENPNVKATVLLLGTPMIGPYMCDRVRIVVTPNGVVATTPRVG